MDKENKFVEAAVEAPLNTCGGPGHAEPPSRDELKEEWMGSVAADYGVWGSVVNSSGGVCGGAPVENDNVLVHFQIETTHRPILWIYDGNE